MKKFFSVCLVLALAAGAFLMIDLAGRVNVLQAEKSVLQRKRDTAQALYEQTKKELAAAQEESGRAQADWQKERAALAGEIDGLNEALADARARLDSQEAASRQALADWETEKSALEQDRLAAEERLQAVTALLMPEDPPAPEAPAVDAPAADTPAKELTSIFFP